MKSKDKLKEIDIKKRTCYLKILSGANSLIGNNNIRSAPCWKLKTTDLNSLKY